MPGNVNRPKPDHLKDPNNRQTIKRTDWDIIDSEDAPLIDGDELKVVFVNMEKDANSLAIEVAHTRLQEEIENSKFKKVPLMNWAINKVWRGSLGQDYLVQKYKKEALEKINEEGSIYADFLDVDQDKENANNTTIERFMKEGDEFINKDAGESKNLLNSDKPEAVVLQNIVKDLLSHKIDNPDLEEGSFQEVVKAELTAYGKKYNNKDLIKQGEFYINNLSTIADVVKMRADHLSVVEKIDKDVALRQVLSKVEVIHGESRNTSRTERRLSKTEQIIEKVGSYPLVSPEVVALAVGFAGTILGKGSRSLVSKTIPVFGAALGSGVFGAIQENRRIEEDRNLHQRQMAQGAEIKNLSDKMRADLEKMQYDTVKSKDVIEALKKESSELPDIGRDVDPENRKILIKDWIDNRRNNFDGSDEEFYAIIADELKTKMSEVAFIDSRLSLSDKNKIDLIHYSSLTSIEQERMDICEQKSQINRAIQEIIKNVPEVSCPLYEGLDGTETDPEQKYIKMMDWLKGCHSEEIKKDIDEKDRNFNSYKARKVVSKFAVETIKGATFGLIAQEVSAFFRDDTQGLFESSGDGRNQTLLKKLINPFVANNESRFNYTEQGNISGVFDENANVSFKIGGDMKLVPDSLNGKVDIIDPSGKIIVDDLEFYEDGGISESSLDLLKSKGFDVDSTVKFISGEPQKITKFLGGDDFVLENKDKMIRTSIASWWDNDTTAFDQNELRLDLGLNENGEIKLYNGRMYEGGSFAGGELANHKLAKMFVSAGRASQKLNFEFSPDADGYVTITKDHPAYQLFSINKGEVQFKGGFIQAANDLGLNENGEKIIKPLATIVGEDNFDGGIMEFMETPEPQSVFDYTLTPPVNNFSDVFELPPFVPIYSRKTMSSVEYKKFIESDLIGLRDDYYEQNQNQYSSDERSKFYEKMSEKFYPFERRQALDGKFSAVGDWYKHNIEKNNGKEYSNWIEKKIKESGLSKMSPKTEAILQIPVYAAGNSESENIYKMLEKGYASQIRKDNNNDKVAIFMNVNWGFNDEKDPAKLENIRKTIEDIKRFQSDNPDIQIYPIYNTFTDIQQKRSGQVINQVTKHNTDILIEAINQKSKTSANPNFNPLIIKNDADAEAISGEYFTKMIEAARNNPDQDIFSGQTYFDRKIADKNPSLMLTLEMMMIQSEEERKTGSVHTAGANFACRAKAIAETGIGFNGEMFGAGMDDLQFGRMIEAMRKKKEKHGQTFANPLSNLVEGAKIMTNAERQVNHYRSGKDGIEVWGGDQFYNESGYVNRSNSTTQTRQDDIELFNNFDNLPNHEKIKAIDRFAERVESGFSKSLSFEDPKIGENIQKYLNKLLGVPTIGVAGSQTKPIYNIVDGKIKFTDLGKHLLYRQLIQGNANFLSRMNQDTASWDVLN